MPPSFGTQEWYTKQKVCLVDESPCGPVARTRSLCGLVADHKFEKSGWLSKAFVADVRRRTRGNQEREECVQRGKGTATRQDVNERKEETDRETDRRSVSCIIVEVI